jgi:hypothetical protein
MPRRAKNISVGKARQLPSSGARVSRIPADLDVALAGSTDRLWVLADDSIAESTTESALPPSWAAIDFCRLMEGARTKESHA